MPRENVLTTAAARLAGVPFALSRKKAFHEPHKALILLTCCLSQVMLATPLLAALGAAYPKARFDWAVGSWARPAIAGNPRVTEIVDTGRTHLSHWNRRQIAQLVRQLKAEHYDTAVIPSSSALASYIAWRAGIHQRIGLNLQGRGFAHTIRVTPPANVKNRGEQGLLLAEAAGVERALIEAATMEFYPPSSDRMAVTRRLVEEVDWLGDVPLVIMHIGGGVNPRHRRELIRWPEERFAVLGNHLVNTYGAKIVLAGIADERPLADDIAGMMVGTVANYCGHLTLGELGAFCEVADLYVGNDTGTSHIAAATGCQTLVIFGPTDPAFSKPYCVQDNVHTLWYDLREPAVERSFTWDIGVTVKQAITIADRILQRPADRDKTLAILSGRSRGEP